MLDILFCMLFLFFCVCVLQASVMKMEASKKNVESKAEFLITITWPDGYNDDIDTYLEDPLGNIIFYEQKQKGLMHLDRDDLGTSNDRAVGPDGKTKLIRHNIEVATLRGYVAGEYTLNIHAFNLSNLMYGEDGLMKEKPDSTGIVPVKIKIEKLNPYSIVLIKEIELSYKGQEETVCRFTLDDEGKVTEINDLEKRFIKNKPVGPVEGPNP